MIKAHSARVRIPSLGVELQGTPEQILATLKEDVATAWKTRTLDPQHDQKRHRKLDRPLRGPARIKRS